MPNLEKCTKDQSERQVENCEKQSEIDSMNRKEKKSTLEGAEQSTEYLSEDPQAQDTEVSM